MKLTINNYDGNGAVDYSACVVEGQTFRVERKLNAPSVLTVSLLPSAAGLPVPSRNGRVLLADDSGNLFFTGYVANEPAMMLAGEASSGPMYVAEMSAISDEVLLDRMALAQQYASYNQSAQTMMSGLTGGLGATPITAGGANLQATIGQFIADHGMVWSEGAAELAASTRGAYRVQNGVLTAEPIGNSIHKLLESDGSLSLSDLQAAQVKMLANDITVCGETEPSAYVTEYFEGDGVTALFDLTELPFVPTAAEARPVEDSFQGPSFNLMLWQISDNGYLGMSSNGLTCAGGNGLDGSIYLAALGQVELGGSIIFETNGVQFGANTQGTLNSIYNGFISKATCVAGFQISQSSGVTSIAPLIGGVISGSTFTPVSGHIYTLRLRLYCNENQRVQQYYYYEGDSGLMASGGQIVSATVTFVLEVQDTTGGVAGAPTILYTGTVPTSLSTGLYVPLNSDELQCSIGNVTVTRGGPTWVMSTPPNGTPMVRRLGTTAQGADCKVESTGKLRFYPGSIPQAGEVVAVSYRTRHRAVARVASAASIASESAGGLPGTAAWAGTVSKPAARSSQDCANAAQALLALATSRASAWAGTYTGWNYEQSGDVWPGDVLIMESTSAGINANLVVRQVRIDLTCSQPGLAKYTIQFANDWADELSIKTSATIPVDVWLPQQPQAAAPLANLNALSITSVTASQIDISANVTPPTGGGFEVRRRDWAFGPGMDADLVLRSPVPNFIIPRTAVMEQYYIRMYDGSTPPNYSEFSTAVFVNLPL
ncbi:MULTISPECIES: hypothetical protein [Acidobacterium]|uniref:Uncharacterized protein n=1 Tax=Acidobacterium capsulatum (strain ATCC 51196 / DSM 11244 / BCRC 80197 / JCM 7670 / NBRC 15755 / NCIMB 13165 / 161) TaxID=240015 RepID=C1FAF9_ACIC5|nr:MULTISPECIES: hypothetical protein [Acidobacterium]ACO33925.1 hypothetical protein ACP_2358 [Acidobacterium capsulatum ATCC 51196]HCT62393.1 hypothetical protein [Acidobacterium sp.]